MDQIGTDQIGPDGPPASQLQTLTQWECLELLRRHSVGRVAFTERAMPAIRPVNYAVVGSQIVLRTRGDGLAERLDWQVVAFEVDEVDAARQCGWSVVVTGTARVPRDLGELVRLDSVPVVAWAGPDHATAVVITPGQITGRRLVPCDPVPAL